MKKYFMPENNATYLKDKDASKCTPFTGKKTNKKPMHIRKCLLFAACTHI